MVITSAVKGAICELPDFIRIYVTVHWAILAALYIVHDFNKALPKSLILRFQLAAGFVLVVFALLLSRGHD
jgi:hypothetical protein